MIGVFAFFFFFTVWQSASFEDPAFLRFVEACFAVRRLRPSLTVRALRTVLTVAASNRSLGYGELAELLGHDYGATAHQVAALSEGRGMRPGLRLLQRSAGDRERARLVTCTRLGRAIGLRYIVDPLLPRSCAENAGLLSETIFPALDHILVRNADITLGSLAAFLFICTHQEEFGYDGSPVYIIRDAIGLTNLSKHIRVLEDGNGTVDSQLIKTIPNDYDNRIKLPALTAEGSRLACEVVAALTKGSIIPARRPKADALDRLDSPGEIDTLDDDDFENITWT